MDEKKVREAICKLKVGINAKREKIKHNKVFFPKQDNSQLEEDIDIYETAIEALEKQLAIKPKEVVGGIYREFYECKNCGSEIEPLDIYEDYCKWCGQRLDWAES